jgi:hypothetical protein
MAALRIPFTIPVHYIVNFLMADNGLSENKESHKAVYLLSVAHYRPIARKFHLFFRGIASDRPERTETIAVQGCIAIYKGIKPLKMKESRNRIF